MTNVPHQKTLMSQITSYKFFDGKDKDAIRMFTSLECSSEQCQYICSYTIFLTNFSYSIFEKKMKVSFILSIFLFYLFLFFLFLKQKINKLEEQHIIDEKY